MKIKNFLKIAFVFLLTAGPLGVVLAKSNDKATQVSAADVTTGRVLMNTNGNIRYISKSDNPDVWSSSSSDKQYAGLFYFSDFLDKGGISNGWGTPASDGSGTLLNTPFTYTGRATNSITFTESEASSKCVGLYIPICFYAASVPAYTKVTFKVNVNITVSGGSSRNFVTAQFFHGGNVQDNAKQDLPGGFYIPKDSTYLKTIGDIVLNIGQGDNAGSLSSRGTFSYYATVENTTGTAKHMEAYYGGLFLGGRKDSSTTHKIVGTISASASEIETTKFVCVNSTTGKNYTSLVTACGEVSNGDTIVLNSDATSTTLNLNRNFTLDLNGHNINLNTSYMYVYANYSVTLKGTGTIKSHASSSTISNSGTLTVPSTVSIVNDYESASSYGIANSGTLNFAGSVTSFAPAIKINDGKVYVTGGTVTSTYHQAIYLNNGSLYLSNSPTISSGSSKEHIYMNIASASLYGYNKTYYAGSSLNLKLSALPAVNSVVVNTTFNNKFIIVNEPAYGYEFQYVSGDRNIVYVKRETFTITYNANGGTGTMTDPNTYFKNDSATVLANTFTRKYYTFSHWNTNADDKSVNYLGGGKITVTSNVTLYAIWVQLENNLLDYFVDKDLLMETYDIGLDNSQGTNMCKTYYSEAKSKYIALSASCKHMFATNNEYENGRNRLKAWALANGEVFDPSNYTFTKNSANGHLDLIENNSTVTIVSAAIMVLVPCGLIFIKRRKIR